MHLFLWLMWHLCWKFVTMEKTLDVHNGLSFPFFNDRNIDINNRNNSTQKILEIVVRRLFYLL